MAENIIEVKNLKKSYGNVKAVRDISFYVEKGKLFAFLGPNGAGKSTTIDTICTFLKPDSGEITVDGHLLGREDKEIRNIIGAVFQDGLLDERLTVKENMETRGSFYGLKGSKLREAVKKAAKDTEIEEYFNRPYGKLSGGQKRRADIARALVNTPKILFMDEPTTGLDPQTRKMVWETIEKLQKATDMTIFLTTHYMEEAAAADYIIIIDHGKIAAKGTPTELKDQYAVDILKLSVKNDENRSQVTDLLKKEGISYKKSEIEITVKLESTMDSFEILDSCRSYISGFEVIRGTMDDAFIEITGKEIRE